MDEERNTPAEPEATMTPEASVAPSSQPTQPTQPSQPVQFEQIGAGGHANERSPLDLILDVQLEATVELGRSRMSIRDVLSLGPGSVVELDKLAGEPADLLINGKPLARGEVIVIDEDFGIRITEILSPTERINTLR